MTKITTNEKLKKRCEILDKVVSAISDVYENDADDDQKRLIETVIGAAIWYLPHNEKYWTGRISDEAKKMLSENKNSKLTKEHQFPRKIAARELLTRVKNDEERKTLLELYEEKYAKFNYVTPKENKKISRHQKQDIFVDIESAYLAAEIILHEISSQDLKSLRKGKFTPNASS